MSIAADHFSVAFIALGLFWGLCMGGLVHSGTRLALGKRADPLIGGSLMGAIAMAISFGGLWWWVGPTVLVGHALSVWLWSRHKPDAKSGS